MDIAMKLTVFISSILLGSSVSFNYAPESKAHLFSPVVKNHERIKGAGPEGTIYIIIDKSDYELQVYDDKGWYATYPVVFGSSSLDDKEMEGGFYPPGFGLQGTSVFCPLSKSLVIRGRFDDRVDAIELPADAVAGINSRTIFYADQRIYAENDRFRFLDQHFVMRYGLDLLSMLLTP